MLCSEKKNVCTPIRAFIGGECRPCKFIEMKIINIQVWQKFNLKVFVNIRQFH